MNFSFYFYYRGDFGGGSNMIGLHLSCHFCNLEIKCIHLILYHICAGPDDPIFFPGSRQPGLPGGLP